VTSSGKLFQTLAPAVGKARLPTVVCGCSMNCYSRNYLSSVLMAVNDKHSYCLTDTTNVWSATNCWWSYGQNLKRGQQCRAKWLRTYANYDCWWASWINVVYCGVYAAVWPPLMLMLLCVTSWLLSVNAGGCCTVFWYRINL